MISETQEAVEGGPAKPAASEATIASLLGDIVTDGQRLMKQHLELFRHEVREDFRKSKRATTEMAVAWLLGLAAGMLAIAMLIGLLTWAQPDVPWWAWCGVICGVASVASCVFCVSAKKKFASINPLPEQTARAIKEDVQWLKS